MDVDLIKTICSPDASLFFIAVPKTASTYTISYFSNVEGTRFFSGGHCVCQKKAVWYYDRAWNNSCLDNPHLQTSVPFSVVRNPFDLLVSMYVYGLPYYFPGMPQTSCAVRSGKEPYWPFSSFEDFCIKFCDPDFPWIVPPQKRFLYFQLFDDSGKCVPRFLIRQERLNEGLDILSKVLNIQPSTNLTYRRSRTSRYHYKKFYDEKLVSLVTEKCGNELRAFGYTFDGHDNSIFIDTEAIHYDHRDNTVTPGYWDPNGTPITLDTDYEMMRKDFHPYKLRGYSCLELLTGIYRNIYLYTRKKLKMPVKDLGGGSMVIE
jgi:hypothetical protein